MVNLLKELLDFENLVEQVIEECREEHKAFYQGFLKGLKEARTMLIREIKNK